jgi:hypothetical protein
MVGLIPASSFDLSANQAALGQSTRIPKAKGRGTQNIVAGPTPPAGGGVDFGYADLVINRSKMADPIEWSGEEYVAVGGQYPAMRFNEYAQAFRAIIKEVETDLALEGVVGAASKGNVYGTPGTPPFDGSLNDLSQILKILHDNGAPTTDLQFVANTDAAAHLRALTNLVSVADAGENDLLRRGVFNNIYGFNIRESAAYRPVEPGAGAGYLANGGAAIGDMEVIVDTGSGTISKGALITFASDTANKYVVAEDVPSGGTIIKLASPLKAAVADNATVTLAPAYNPSLGFARDFLYLATRQPPMPEGGDGARDVVALTDPISGLTFQAALYGGFHQNTVVIGLNWGVKAVNEEHGAVLLG